MNLTVQGTRIPLKATLVAVALGLSGLTLTACVDDGYRRPGLVVVDQGRDHEYRRDERLHTPRYERRDYRNRRDYWDRRHASRLRDHCVRFPRDRACYQ